MLLPSLWILLEKVSNSLKFRFLAIIVLIYSILLAFTLGSHERIAQTNGYFLSRFELYKYNFQDWNYSIESIFSIILALGIPSYLLWANSKDISKKFCRWMNAYIIAAVVCIIVFLFLAKARESRLFATALVFLWPILGPYVYSFFIDLRSLSRNYWAKAKWEFLAIIVGTISLSVVISYLLYRQTGQWPNSNFHNEFLFIGLSVIGLHFTLKFLERRESGIVEI